MSIETVGNILKETKEVANMAYNPMIKEWELYFEKANGYDNRTAVVKAFAKFWEDSAVDKLKIPGKCMLGGRVFGRKGFNDGDEIFTSDVELMERIEHGNHNGIPHDLMCATTVSGSKYYFYSDEHNAYMFLMLGDLFHTGKLSQDRYYYLKREFHSSKLI